MAAMAQARGAFILFEGIDRCGKSTQVRLLTEGLNAIGQSSEAIRFPNRDSNIGQLINSYLTSTSNLNDQTIHLLFSANRWESSKDIESKLLSGTNLICDRYAYSGVAFSSAKGIDFDWCMNCDVGLPAPDCVIYFDMPVENASKRGSYGEERYEKLEFQRLVQQQFRLLQSRDENMRECGGDNHAPEWAIINAEQTIEEIQQEFDKIQKKIRIVPQKRWFMLCRIPTAASSSADRRHVIFSTGESEIFDPWMFARNQIWRAVQRGNSDDNLPLVENNEDYPSNTFLPRRISSNEIPPVKSSKQVRFSDTCRVVLIPCLKEYRSLGLHMDMWWEEKDYRSFKHSAKQEVSNFISSFGGDVKSIMRQLYQPDSAMIGLIGLEG